MSPPARRWFQTAPVVGFTAVISGVIAVGTAHTAVTEGGAGYVVVALFMGAVPVLMVLGLRRDPGPWSLGELDGRPAWRLRLGPLRGVALAVAGVLGALGAGAAYGAFRVGAVAGAIVLGVAAAAAVLLAGELGRVASRAPAFLIGDRRLRYDGAGLRVDLDWDDVGTVEWSR